MNIYLKLSVVGYAVSAALYVWRKLHLKRGSAENKFVRGLEDSARGWGAFELFWGMLDLIINHFDRMTDAQIGRYSLIGCIVSVLAASAFYGAVEYGTPQPFVRRVFRGLYRVLIVLSIVLLVFGTVAGVEA